MSRTEPPGASGSIQPDNRSQQVGGLPGGRKMTDVTKQTGTHLTAKAFAASFFSSLAASGIIFLGVYYGTNFSPETLRYIATGLGGGTLLITAGATGYASGKESVRKRGVRQEARQLEYRPHHNEIDTPFFIRIDQENTIFDIGRAAHEALERGGKLIIIRRGKRYIPVIPEKTGVTAALLPGDKLYLNISEMSQQDRTIWQNRYFETPLDSSIQDLMLVDFQPKTVQLTSNLKKLNNTHKENLSIELDGHKIPLAQFLQKPPKITPNQKVYLLGANTLPKEVKLPNRERVELIPDENGVFTIPELGY